MNPCTVEEYSGFPTSLLGNDLLTTVFVLPWPSLTLWTEQPRVLPVLLIFNSVLWKWDKKSLDLGHFANEYLKSMISDKNKQMQKNL